MMIFNILDLIIKVIVRHLKNIKKDNDIAACHFKKSHVFYIEGSVKLDTENESFLINLIFLG